MPAGASTPPVAPASPPSAPAAVAIVPAVPAYPSNSAAPPQYPPAAQYPQAAPAAPAPTYTLDQLSVAATPLLDNGRQQELSALLARFGVASLTTLPPEHYGAFALALRSMGAQI
jgi:hypothetical protein